MQNLILVVYLFIFSKEGNYLLTIELEELKCVCERESESERESR